MVRTATPFPMVSLLFVFTAFVISNIGHIQPQRTILAFVSGIFFILSGTRRRQQHNLIDYSSPVSPPLREKTLLLDAIFSACCRCVDRRKGSVSGEQLALTIIIIIINITIVYGGLSTLLTQDLFSRIQFQWRNRDLV